MNRQATWVVLLMSPFFVHCAHERPSEFEQRVTHDAQLAMSADEWEVPLRYEIGESLQELDPGSFAWVPDVSQSTAIQALADVSIVRLSEEQAEQFGASELTVEGGSVTFPVLLRGVRVTEADEGSSSYESDRLSVEWAGSSLRVIHYATRPFPFESKQARAVVARLLQMPSDVSPVTSIVFTGGVR